MKTPAKVTMADRIMAGHAVRGLGKYPPGSDINERNNALTREHIAASTIIDYQNVAEYSDSLFEREFHITQFFNVRAPFPLMWLESARYDGAWYRTAVTIHESPPILVSDFTPEYKRRINWLPGIEIPERVCVQRHSVFRLHNSKDDIMFLGGGTVAISESGAPLSNVFVSIAGDTDSALHDGLAGTFIHECFPALLALQFMNCKNIRLQSHEPPAAFSKAHQKRNGRPLLRYHTLEIEPMKQVLETEGGISHNGLKKALHICRGHFRTNTPEKGMFGRKLDAPVTYWVPAHVRGDAREGIVAKDYRVKAPKVTA